MSAASDESTFPSSLTSPRSISPEGVVVVVVVAGTVVVVVDDEGAVDDVVVDVAGFVVVVEVVVAFGVVVVVVVDVVVVDCCEPVTVKVTSALYVLQLLSLNIRVICASPVPYIVTFPLLSIPATFQLSD